LRAQFAALRSLRDRVFVNTLLNMGTSSDYEMAIEEGADVLRLGSVLFGERSYG
jgi:uncharacterized pyridoxal phosphate-containing UPF0001 family protein